MENSYKLLEKNIYISYLNESEQSNRLTSDALMSAITTRENNCLSPVSFNFLFESSKKVREWNVALHNK